MKQFTKFGEDIAAKIAIALADAKVKELIEKTKAAADSGTFEVVISTDNEDRQGEVLDQGGLDLTFFKTNPVVLWAHDYQSLPIGIAESIETVDGKTIARGKFAPADANPFAQQVRKLYDEKFVRTVSVGFIAKEMKGNSITKSELLEFSFVPVPANPYALSMREVKEMGLDCEMLKVKGIEIAEKGDVTDEAAKREARQKKWENLNKVDDVICAFFNVYLDEDIAVEEFNNLLAETVQLLAKILPVAQETVSTEVEKAMGGGKKMADLRLEKLFDAINGLKADIAALQKGGEEEKPEPVEPPKETSNPAGPDDAVQGAKALAEAREVLRTIATATSDALQKFNEVYRKK